MFFNKGTNVSALIICWGFQRFLKIPQDILSLKGSASTTVCNLLDSAALCICIYVFVFVFMYLYLCICILWVFQVLQAAGLCSKRLKEVDRWGQALPLSLPGKNNKQSNFVIFGHFVTVAIAQGFLFTF